MKGSLSGWLSNPTSPPERKAMKRICADNEDQGKNVDGIVSSNRGKRPHKVAKFCTPSPTCGVATSIFSTTSRSPVPTAPSPAAFQSDDDESTAETHLKPAATTDAPKESRVSSGPRQLNVRFASFSGKFAFANDAALSADGTTILTIPASLWGQLSPFEKQWFEIKSSNMDVVLFFKKGKFYELYEHDADIGAHVLGLAASGGSRGSMRMSGVPESSFGVWARELIVRGYKVGRVEQMASRAAIDAAAVNNHQKEKIVPRELVEILTPGTAKGFDVEADGRSGGGLAVLTVVSCDKSSCEECQPRHGERCRDVANTSALSCGARWSFAVVDAPRGLLAVGDEPYSLSAARTLLSATSPTEVLLPAAATEEHIAFVRRMVTSHGGFVSQARVPSASECTKLLAQFDVAPLGYTPNLLESPALRTVIGYLSRLRVLKSVLGPATLLRYSTARGLGPLDASSPSSSMLVDSDTRSVYKSPRCVSVSCPCGSQHDSFTVPLSGASLAALEICPQGVSAVSLLGHYGRSITPQGRRGVKQWLLHPLNCLSGASLRQKAVTFLVENLVLKDMLEVALRPISFDIETSLARLLGKAGRVDGRMIDVQWAVRKDVISLKKVLTSLLKFVTDIEQLTVDENLSIERSGYLATLCAGLPSSGVVEPIVMGILSTFTFESRACHSAGPGSSKDKVAVPIQGLSDVYDAAAEEVEACEAKLNKLLAEIRRESRVSSLQWKAIGKEPFTIEVPTSGPVKGKKAHSSELSAVEGAFAKLKLGHMDVLATTAKTAKVSCEKIRTLATARAVLVDKRDTALTDALQCVLVRLNEHAVMWRAIVSISAQIDSVLCFASTALADKSLGGACAPLLLPLPSDILSSESLSATAKNVLAAQPILIDSVRLSFLPVRDGFDVIANSVALGAPDDLTECQIREVIADCEQAFGRSRADSSEMIHRPTDTLVWSERLPAAPALLLTGPNMGGKSTLMRAVGTAVVLALCGAWIPAHAAVIPMLDHICVRMGAQDDLLRGRSTFALEMEDTAEILRCANARSLVLADEVGRGTSSTEGAAIALATAQALTPSPGRDRVRRAPLSILTTHYSPVISTLLQHPNVAVRHMSFATAPDVPSEADRSSHQDTKKLVFLYQLSRGVLPSSFGIDVAAIAGIPPNVIAAARNVALAHRESSSGDLWAASAQAMTSFRNALMRQQKTIESVSL